MKPANLAHTVDALGKLRAKIALLEIEDKALCEVLKNSGESHVTGRLYEATIVETSKTTVDMVMIKEVLNPQFLADHSKFTPYMQVRVSPRKPKEHK